MKDTDEMIGDCGLTMQNIGGVICPEIGYHIRRDKQRNGYAKEAAAAVWKWASVHTPFRRSYSYMKEDNVPSAATAKSIGMTFDFAYTDGEGDITAVYSIEISR